MYDIISHANTLAYTLHILYIVNKLKKYKDTYIPRIYAELNK